MAFAGVDLNNLFGHERRQQHGQLSVFVLRCLPNAQFAAVPRAECKDMPCARDCQRMLSSTRHRDNIFMFERDDRARQQDTPALASAESTSLSPPKAKQCASHKNGHRMLAAAGNVDNG